MGAATAFDEDAAGLLSVLRAAPRRAKAQLDTTTGPAPVDTRLKSPGSTTPVDLGASERSLVVRTAVCSQPASHGLIHVFLGECHLGSSVREICTLGSAWGDELKRPCPLGEASARKRTHAPGSAQATVVKTRLYHPARRVVYPTGATASAGYQYLSPLRRRLCHAVCV